MHESHQVQRLIKEAEQMAAARQLASVKRVSIVVGQSLGFDEMSIRLHWEEMADGTRLEAAELVIRFIPAQLKCPKCAKLFEKKGSDLSCPACQVLGVPTSAGKEFSIEGLS